MTSFTDAAPRAAIYRGVFRKTAVNAPMAIPAIRRMRLRRPRNSVAFDGSTELLDRSAFQALRELERLIGPLQGRSVVEFGPGDHLAAGLAMLAAGASRYTRRRCSAPSGLRSPHDCWLRYADPLMFLRFPPALWRAMSSHRGSPHRCRHHEFVAALTGSGLDVSCHDVGSFDLGAVDMTKLHATFRELSRDSLRVHDVIYVCLHASASDR